MSDSTLSPLFDEFPAVSTEAWHDKIREDLGGADPASALRWTSIEGVSLPGLQRREDLDALPHVSADAPASPLSSTEAPGNPWRLRQNIRHPDPATAAEHARLAVDGGCTDLGLVLAAPSRRDRLSFDAADALDTLLRDLPLDDVTLHLERGPSALVLYCALRNRTDDDASISVAYDPVAALATGACAEDPSVFDGTATLLSESDAAPHRPVTVDLRPYHDAGASAVQEVVFGLGALSETLHQLTERGFALSTLVPHLQVLTATATSYFVEIAKLRALRLLVSQVLNAYADEADASIDTAPGNLFVQSETSRRTETLYDPYVNMLRGTTAAMAAVLGGCDVLSVRSHKTSPQPPTRFGNRIARNVQLILREEAHFDVVDDPAAGSYYLETATDRLAQAAWKRFQRLEVSGGILDALRTERLQSDIADVRTQRRAAVDDREQVLVGTNHYPDLEETRSSDLDDLPCNNGTEETQRDADGLDAIRAGLDRNASIPGPLRGLTDDAPPYEPLPRIRVSTGLERVRLRTERAVEDADGPPVVLLVPLGPAAARSARATFARNVLGVAGFDVNEPLKFDSPAEAADTAADDPPDLVVLCSADAEYPTLTPALRSALSNHGLSPLLLVAGNPARIEGDVPADDFLYSGQPLRDTLTALQERLGLPPLDADDG